MPFISFSCFVAFTKNSSVVLTKSDDSILSDPRDKTFSISALRKVLFLGFLWIFFIRLKYSSFYSQFLSWVGIRFSQMLFLYLLIGSYNLFLPFYVTNYINWVLNVEPALHTQNKSHLVMVCEEIMRCLQSGGRLSPDQAGTLIFDFQPPELWEINCCL